METIKVLKYQKVVKLLLITLAGTIILTISSKIKIPLSSESSKNGDNVTLGIRPEHLLVNENADASWESKVFVVEKLGSGTFLYLEKEGEPLVVETEGNSSIKVGDTVKIGFTAESCHLFDVSNQAFIR